MVVLYVLGSSSIALYHSALLLRALPFLKFNHWTVPLGEEAIYKLILILIDFDPGSGPGSADRHSGRVGCPPHVEGV